jgi:hypothetical protein
VLSSRCVHLMLLDTHEYGLLFCFLSETLFWCKRVLFLPRSAVSCAILDIVKPLRFPSYFLTVVMPSSLLSFHCCRQLLCTILGLFRGVLEDKLEALVKSWSNMVGF